MGSQAHADPFAGELRAAAVADRPTFTLGLTVPLAWQPLAGAPADALLEELERSNGQVVAMLLKCADLGAPPIEDEVLAEALEPLRTKLDLIADMLARLSYRDLALPEARAIELGLAHLRWSQAAPPPADSWLLCRLYFHDLFREPVTLAGRVARLSGEGAGRSRIELDVADMPPSLGESFARLIFLEHRRQQAQKAGRHPAARRSP
jgi:hypothetical protein